MSASSISVARLESAEDLTIRTARQSIANIQKALGEDNIKEADRQILLRAERSERYLLTGRASPQRPSGTEEFDFQPSPSEVRRREEILRSKRQVLDARRTILAWLVVSVVALLVGFKSPLGGKGSSTFGQTI